MMDRPRRGLPTTFRRPGAQARQAQHATRVRVLSIAEQAEIRRRLEEVAKPGTDPFAQMQAIQYALRFKDAYYYAGRTLRRVFPKDAVIFSGVPKGAPSFFDRKPAGGMSHGTEQLQTENHSDQ